MKVPWDIIHFFPNETIWLNMKAVIAMLLIVLFSCSPPRARHGGKILTAVAAGSRRGGPTCSFVAAEIWSWGLGSMMQRHGGDEAVMQMGHHQHHSLHFTPSSCSL